MADPSEILKLPCELQNYLYDYVLRLRKPVHVLTDELKSDIETYPLLGQIESNYAQVFSSESAPSWIENALINLLNDNRGLVVPFSDRLRRMFPNSTDEEIRTTLRTGHHLHRLWIISPSNLRREMHTISCDMLLYYVSHS